MEKNEINLRLVNHEPIVTKKDLKTKIIFEGECRNALISQSTLYWDKSDKARFWLVVQSIDTKVDIDELELLLEVKRGNLVEADEKYHLKLLGCKKENLNLFAIINDSEHKVKVILDQRLIDAEWMSSFAMENRVSLCINFDSISGLQALTGRTSDSFGALDLDRLGVEEGSEAENLAHLLKGFGKQYIQDEDELLEPQISAET